VNNEDKILGLLEKIYNDFNVRFDVVEERIGAVEGRISTIEERMTVVEKRIGIVEERLKVVEEEIHGLKCEVSEVKDDVKKLGTKMDTEISDKVRALFDDRQILHEKLDEISGKIDMLQLDVNNLTVKTLYHDNRIKELSKKLGV